MAAGVIRRASLLSALLALALFAAGCFAPTGGPGSAAPATPQSALSPAIDAARAAVAAQLQSGGFTLEAPVSGYEPGAPGDLQATPKAVFRVNVIDPGQGWVVIYDAGANDAAIDKGEAFAAYLTSFGHSNYPADAQYTLNVLDSALIFHWWSAQRSSDAERARAAFELVSAVGHRIDVVG